MATGITQEDVRRAADALLREGDRPTIERVRHKMGRGSPNTVGPHLDTWFRGLGARLDGGMANQEGPRLPAAVVEATLTIWRDATRHATDNAQRDLAGERDILEREQRDLERNRDELAQRQNRLQQREVDLQETFAMLTRRLQQAEQQIVQLEDERKAASQQIAELTSLQQSVQHAHSSLVTQLSAERESHAAQSERLEARAQAQERRWLQELDTTRTQLRHAQVQHAQEQKTLQRVLQETRDALEQARQEEQRAHAERAQAGTELLSLQEQNTAHAQRFTAMQEQLAEARATLKTQTQHHEAREAHWQRQLERQHQQYEKLQEQLAKWWERTPPVTDPTLGAVSPVERRRRGAKKTPDTER